MPGPFIVFDRVAFAHADGGRAGRWVLRDFKLTIESGQLYVLLGPSGCGKTTVLHLLAGYLMPTEGRIAVDGQPVTRPGVDRGMVFQGDDSLFYWLTAAQNVELCLRFAGVPVSDRRQVVERCLRLVGLTEHADKYPRQLSGGMKQRIQIARALAAESRILLMDEPFAALDAQTRSALQDELTRIWQQSGRTIMFVTHDILESILLADRIGIMSRGPCSRLVAEVAVDLPRPRGRTHPDVGKLYERIAAELPYVERAS